jgi:hypothetical protein
MNLAQRAAMLHMHLVEHSWHGYTQGSGRWGDGEGVCKVVVDGVTYTLQQGDRDCASSVIEVWKQVLRGTAYEGALDKATYTGDMKKVFLASGLFEWVDVSKAKLGDVYLKPKTASEWGHTSICQGGGRNSEFITNEKGTSLGGKVGDQTGREGLIQDYWGFAKGVLHYNGKADESEVDMAVDMREAVWGHKINGKRADELLALNGSTSDPTGRGVNMNDHDHIKWIAATLVDLRDEVRELRAALEVGEAKIGGTE